MDSAVSLVKVSIELGRLGALILGISCHFCRITTCYAATNPTESPASTVVGTTQKSTSEAVFDSLRGSDRLRAVD